MHSTPTDFSVATQVTKQRPSRLPSRTLCNNGLISKCSGSACRFVTSNNMMVRCHAPLVHRNLRFIFCPNPHPSIPPGVSLAALRNFSSPSRGPLSVQFVPSTYSCSSPRYGSTARSACTCIHAACGHHYTRSEMSLTTHRCSECAVCAQHVQLLKPQVRLNSAQRLHLHTHATCCHHCMQDWM
jgi:hypothetical protein